MKPIRPKRLTARSVSMSANEDVMPIASTIVSASGSEKTNTR